MTPNKIDITPIEAEKMVDGFNLNDAEIRQFTVNEVIQSYKAGVSHGRATAIEQEQKSLMERIKANAALAAKDTLRVITFLKQIGIKALSAHLRIESIYSICVLITVSTDDYVKEDFTQVYKFVSALQNANTNELYAVNFQFINKSDHFDIEAVENAGFTAAFKPLE
jgi:hypothetical protein